MLKKRLLERLKDLEINPEKRFKEDSKENVINSIALHIQKILNVSKGSVPIAKDYGIPDYSELISSNNLTEELEELKKSIEKTILKYEPRVFKIKVLSEKDKSPLILSLKFEIVLNNERKDKIILKSNLNAEQGFTIDS